MNFREDAKSTQTWDSSFVKGTEEMNKYKKQKRQAFAYTVGV